MHLRFCVTAKTYQLGIEISTHRGPAIDGTYISWSSLMNLPGSLVRGSVVVCAIDSLSSATCLKEGQ